MPIPKKRRITADEFFAMTPEDNRQHVELIDGEIVDFASPNLFHQKISGKLYSKIMQYIEANKGGCVPVIAPFDVKIDDYNTVQPDVMVICDPDKLSDGKRCNGAPDFVIEVTSLNKKVDCVTKLNLYCDAGVMEYWIVDPDNKKVLVYRFYESEFPNIYTFEQDIPVGIFKGQLIINIAELL